MLKVQDSFNEKNLNNSNINNKTKSNVSFTGHKVIQNDNGENLYRFYLPALKENDKASVQIVTLVKDDNGNYQVLGNKNKTNVKEFEFKSGENHIDRHFELHGLTDNPKELANIALGYKFKINGKDYLDSTLLTPDRQWNIATPPSRPILEEARSMYHIMPDLMLSKAIKKENPFIYDARRTHFNKLGGNIDGIIEKIDYMDKLGVKRILSTPIFGQDNLSSHGYWTTNPYQVTDGLGDISKFKQMNTELFKKGMGWIADGAFVNEGLEGVHLAHVTKYGTQSPYANWFETFDFPDKAFKFGILPKKEAPKEFINYKLINSPYKINSEYDENGKFIKEKVVSNLKKDGGTYDTKKPTYIQVYDSRLASEKQRNSDEIIRSYANKNPKDQNEINDYMDSAVPYCFEVTSEDVETNYQKWQKSKEKNPNERFKENLGRWSNFEMVNSDDAGGLTLWVGNRDIAKLRFMLTPEKADEIRSKCHSDEEADQKIQKIETSINQVQDNIVQVGEFWTNEVSKTLQSHTAKQLSGVKDAKGYAEKIQYQVKNGELPQAALKVTEGQIKNLLNGSYSLKTAPVPQNVTDGLMSYPLDAVEFSSGMSGILGSPFLKKLASSETQIGKSRYEIFAKERAKTEDKKYAGAVPEEFRPVYQQMDNVIADQMTRTAVEILQEVENTGKVKAKIVDDETGNLTEDGKQLYSLISNDVAKFIVTQGLLTEASKHSPELFKDEKLSPKENKDALEYDKKLLSKVSPQSLDINAASPAQEAEILISRLKSGISMIGDEDKQKFAEHLAGRLEGLDGNTVKVAKLVVDKAEGGLEWRIDAAKDVCPVEEILEGKADFESNWDKGIKFWEKFTQGVRKYNPRAYEILEVTDEGGLVQANPVGKREKYTDMQEASMKLIQGANATTPTNYNFFYSLPHRLFGSFTEEDNHDHCGMSEVIKNILCAWAEPGEHYNTLGHLHAGSLDTANHAHNSMGNHDKPRAAHLFGLNTDTFFNEGKGKAMGDALKESFGKSYKANSIPETVQKDIKQAVDNLSTGKYHVKKDGHVVEKQIDSEYFGVRPFDRNIKDVLIEAKLISKTTSEYIDSNSKIVEQLEKDTLKEMLAPALKKYRAAMGFLVAVNGNPTVYAGDELGETGFENKYKNTYVQNRNFNHYNRAEQGNSDNIQKIENQKNDIAKLMNLRKQEALSPLVNGSTVVLDTQNADVAGLYRYNDEKDMFILMNNKGFGPTRAQAGLKDGEKVSVEHIDLSQETMLDYEAAKGTKVQQGLLNNLQAGATYKNALEKDDSTYRIVDAYGKKLLKKYDENGKPVNIEMTGTDLFLYREKNFDGKPNELSFSGNSQKKNPHVAIMNMKYNIPRK